MAKYSYELKKKIVEEYLSGKTSYPVLENKYQIGESQIRRWVNNYKQFGDEGLMRSRNNRAYSVEFKLEAITRYETSDRNQAPNPSKSSEDLDASTREALENRIKELEAENRKLTIQKMFWEQLRSLEREEATNKRRRSSPNSENNSN